METIHVTHEPGGILSLTFTGEISSEGDLISLKESIQTVAKAIRELHTAQGKGIKVIINITDFTAGYLSEGIEALIELARQDKELVEKTAVFGGSEKIKVIGETIAALAGRKNIHFFNTKEEAIQWLS